MAVDFPMPQGGFTKRKSLQEQLNRLTELPDDEEGYRARFEMIESLHEDVRAAKDHRWHAPSTQNRQDTHLLRYKQFVLSVLNRNENWQDVDEAEWKEKLFPVDVKGMINKMQLFLTWVFRHAVPRSKAANTIDIGTLCQYRDSLMFWAGHYYYKAERDLPRARLYYELVRQMRYTYSRYGDKYTYKNKTWLGLAELRQLLDYEATMNRCIELSEQHQVLWCIGRVTALRPGSLCPGTRHARRDALKWSNFRFFRGNEKGMFRSELAVDHINIKRPDDPLALFEHDIQSFPLTIKFPSPQPHNLVFSPTHRLLVIALRRNILDGIESIDDLINGAQNEIFIKKEHEQDNVFYRGKFKGHALDAPYPLSAVALTEYLKRRGRQIGYTNDISWYSIRRRAATDMVQRAGLESARFLLGHGPDSHTLERYYLNWTETLNVMGILTDEEVQNQGKATDWAPLAMEKLENEAYQRSRGRALGELIRHLIMGDDDVPDVGTNSTKMKNYRRRVKRVAERILIDRENEWQRRHITKADVDQRRAALNASHFADEVLRNAREALAQHGQQAEPTQSLESDTAQEDEQVDRLLREETQQEHEPDLEDRVGRQDTAVDGVTEDGLEVQYDDEVDSESFSEGVAYEHLARSAMALWMDNTLTTYATWANKAKICPLCQEDSTADQAHKDKRYNSEIHLQVHIDSNYHHPGVTWRRRLEQDFLVDGDSYQCPYCVQAGAQDVFTSTANEVDALIQHIVDSNEHTTSSLHDELKNNDGWYSSTWEDPRNIGPTAASLLKKKQAGKKRLAQEFGIDTTPYKILHAPIPLAGSSEIMCGGLLPPPPTKYDGTIQLGSHSQPELIPTHFSEEIGTGSSRELMQDTVPPELQGWVEVIKAA